MAKKLVLLCAVTKGSVPPRGASRPSLEHSLAVVSNLRNPKIVFLLAAAWVDPGRSAQVAMVVSTKLAKCHFDKNVTLMRPIHGNL